MGKTRKKDLLGYEELNYYSKPSKKRHISANGQLHNDDESKFQQEEVLVGMEYDLDPDFDKNWPENHLGRKSN